MVQIFVDMDGVLADFDSGYEQRFGIRPSKTDDNVDWEMVRNAEGFYRDLPPMQDFDVLWAGISKYNPILLSGVPYSVDEAPDNKRAWIDKNIGKDQKAIFCRSSQKCKFICEPGDILIDDWEKYKKKWINAGGRWITHISAESTLLQLGLIL